MRRVLALVAVVVVLAAVGWAVRSGDGPPPPEPPAPADAAPRPESAPSLAKATRPLGRVLRGIVVEGRTETPIAGARVVVRSTTPRDEDDPDTDRTVESGPDGRFETADPPAGGLVVRATHPLCVPMGDEPVVEDEQGMLEEVRLELWPGGAVEGVVRGLDGAPWRGGTVRAEIGLLPSREGPIDGDGRYRLESLWPSTYVLTARPAPDRPGHTITASGEILARDTLHLDLDARAGRSIEGRVVSGAAGVGGVRVVAWMPRADDGIGALGWLADEIPIEVVTAPDGTFRISGARGGAPWFVVENARGREGRVVPEPGPGLVLRLPAGRIRGRVRSATDGTPVAGLLVEARSHDLDSDFGYGSVRTDGAGAFELVGLAGGIYAVDTEAVVAERARPDRWLLPGLADGVSVHEGESARCDLDLEPAGGLLVRALDRKAAPVRGLVMYVRQATSKDSDVGHRTGVDGTALVTALAPGEVVVRLGEGRRTVEARARVIPGRTALLDVTVPWRPHGSARVRVRASGPLGRADLAMTLIPEVGDPVPSFGVDPDDPELHLFVGPAGVYRIYVAATAHVPFDGTIELLPDETVSLDVRLVLKPPPDPTPPSEEKKDDTGR